MHGKSLRVLLGLCLLVALIPFFPWLGATFNDGVDDRWLDSLGGLAVSVPIALGLAALVLARHGLLLHRDLVDGMQEGLAELLARDPLVRGLAPSEFQAATTSAPSTFGGPTAVVLERPDTAVVEVPEAEPTPATETDKKKIPKAGSVKRKAAQRAKAKAKHTFRSQLANLFNRGW